jgi:hypothetical protein
VIFDTHATMATAPALEARGLPFVPVHPTSWAQSNSMIYTGFSFILMSSIAVGLRFYTRQYIVRSIGWDDWTILVALVGFFNPL